MVEPSSSSRLVDEPLDRYMIYLWVDQNGRFGRPDLGLTDIPFQFEFFAEDARHALEQFSDDGGLLDEDILISRIEVKQVDPFYNE